MYMNRRLIRKKNKDEPTKARKLERTMIIYYPTLLHSLYKQKVVEIDRLFVDDFEDSSSWVKS